MLKSKIVLIDGTELIVDEKTFITGIRSEKNDGKSLSETDLDRLKFPLTTHSVEHLELIGHHHAGFIPSLTEIFVNYDFFAIDDANKSVYSTNSVLKIVNI